MYIYAREKDNLYMLNLCYLFKIVACLSYYLFLIMFTIVGLDLINFDKR